ncbi:MAG: hypothetical protein IJK83_07905 [Clostridiales bacterium]|nr:hypothetical protein [Clostridiales bacterium]
MLGSFSGLILGAYSVERIIDSIISTLMFGILPVLFIVFLILAIIHIRKAKKKLERPALAIVFSVLAAVFLTLSVCEAVLMMLLAAAVAHM